MESLEKNSVMGLDRRCLVVGMGSGEGRHRLCIAMDWSATHIHYVMSHPQLHVSVTE